MHAKREENEKQESQSTCMTWKEGKGTNGGLREMGTEFVYSF
jgi:hypothetical protein